MGNVIDSGVGDGQSDDVKWMNTPNSTIFNDSYISSIYENLPKFDGTEIPEVDKVVMLFNLYTIFG